jgi:hypothetical protein
MRTMSLNDRQCDNLCRILRKEVFAGYTTAKEKTAADELYMILENAQHEPDLENDDKTESNWEAGLLRFVPPEEREIPQGWREVEA